VVAIIESRVERRSSRLAALDVLRGVAILAMVVYHFSWDLSANGLIGVDVSISLGWVVFARTIAGTFLLLVGVNLVLATRNGFRLWPYLRRLAVIVVAALIVSLGTYLFDPQTFVFFGILHSIAVASVLALLFLRAPVWLTAVVAVFFLAGPHFLTSDFFNAPPWYWLGLSTDPPATVDYVPIFPWFGVVLLGVGAGRFIVDHAGLPLWQWQMKGRTPRTLAFAGRWSLPIYLVHQPILVGILFVVAPLIGPSEAALASQLISEYEASCAVAGYDEEPCSDYAECVLDELAKEKGILITAIRHELSQAQSERWQIAVAECRARTLPPNGAAGI
jgi:uncharacterized membrane protein